jgi:hypothetical protein
MADGWQMNNEYFPAEPKQIFSLAGDFPNLALWSADALSQLYKGLIELSVEMAREEAKTKKGGQKAKLTRLINSSKKRLQYVAQDRNKLIKQIYDAILETEGTGLLHGFGMSNRFGDLIKGDPERQTIYNHIKKGEKEMATEKTKRSELAKAAAELNEVLGLDPVINEKGSTEELTEKLVEAMELIDLEQDEIAETTLTTLKKLGFDDGAGSEPEEIEEAEEDGPEEQEEPEETEPETPLIDQVQSATKLADLKKLVYENEELKSLQRGIQEYRGLSGPRELKKKMLKKLGVDASVQSRTDEGKRRSGSSRTSEYLDFLTNRIKKGKHTRIELTDMTLSEFPEANKSSIQTLLSDGKNPKYNKFETLLVEDDNKIISFKK